MMSIESIPRHSFHVQSPTSLIGMRSIPITTCLLLSVGLLLSSCTGSKSDQAASVGGTIGKGATETTPSRSSIAVPPGAQDTTASSQDGSGSIDAGSAGAVATLPQSTLPVETRYIIPPLEPSPAELAVLAVPSSVKIGSVDNDVKAAAPDTKLPEFVRPSAPITAPPSTFPVLTVPDLGLDSRPAEAVMTAVSWPADLRAISLGDADNAGNAVANSFAGDARLKEALRSGAGRLLRKGENTALVAAVIIVDPSKLGASITDEVSRALASTGVPSVTTFEGKPAVTVELTAGLFQLVVIDGDRLLSVGGGKPDEALIRSAVTSILAASKT
jgi:hypothetical protein